jgi:hypothetical protein
MNLPFILQRRRTPEPGRSFIDRERELDLVWNKIEQIARGTPMRSPVTCFWGTFGMGKSWLLIELQRLYTRASPQPPQEPNTIVARLDLDREIGTALWRDALLDRELLVKEMWRQLAQQMGSPVPDLGRATVDEWADQFVGQVTTWSSHSTIPLIMLDTIDDLVNLDERAFFWLEEHVVEPLAITDQVLFIFASRGELRRWRRFQVRRRVDSQRITAFDEKTAGESVNVDSAVSKAIYSHAFGHPLATDFLGTALERIGVNRQKGPSVEQLQDPFFAKDILIQVTGEILRGVSEQPGMLARYVSVLRWVSIEPLRSLIEALKLVEDKRGDAFYIERIGELQACHLLYWNSSKNAYDVDRELRRLLAHSLELEQPDKFRAAHLAALDFHKRHLDNQPQYLDRYLPELIYHSTILDPLLRSQLQTWRAWWTEFLKKAPAHPEPWTELLKALEQDGELKETLETEDYDSLLSEAQRRSSGA